MKLTSTEAEDKIVARFALTIYPYSLCLLCPSKVDFSMIGYTVSQVQINQALYGMPVSSDIALK
jgi:hypothetical protein